MVLIILLLLIFLALGVTGFAVHGLIWLGIIAAILFLVVAATGYIRR